MLNLREHTLDLSKVKLMGVLNLTPDSFSDGGNYLQPSVALERARQMVQEGADIIDIGGESTRPGAESVSVEEEERRVLPVLEALLELNIPISIDTRRSSLAQQSAVMGAHLINDVTGLRDPAMVQVCVQNSIPAVVMHMSTPDPKTMQQQTGYQNIVEDVRDFLLERAKNALEAGVPQIILDVGFGFGKTTAQNLHLVNHLSEFCQLGFPVLLAASRKKTIGELGGVENPADRISGTLAMHALGVLQGAKILRVHDVAQHRQFLNVFEAGQYSPTATP